MKFNKLFPVPFNRITTLFLMVALICCFATPVFSQDAPVELVVSNHLTREEWHTWFDDLLATYNESHPGVHVTQQSTDFADLQARVATDRLADTPPDIYLLPSWWLGNLVENSIPTPAPDDVAQDVTDNYTPGAVQAVTWDDQLWGVPLDSVPTVMIYNKQMLADAGYDRPPETLDELKEYAAKLTLKDADGNVTQYGYSQWVGSLNWNYLPFVALLYSNGGELFDPETGHAAFNSEAGVEILQMQVDMVNAGYFNPELEAVDWYSDRVAITILPNWVRSYLVTYNDPENYAAAPVPHGEGFDSGSVAYSWFASVNSRSNNQDAAWDFVRWYTQPPEEGTPAPSSDFYFRQASIIPPRRSDLAAMQDDFSTDMFPEFIAALDYAKAPTPVPAYEEIINILITEMENAWFGNKTAQQALDDAATQADALLLAP